MQSPVEYFAEQRPQCPVCALEPEVKEALRRAYGTFVRGKPLGPGRLLRWLNTVVPDNGIGIETLRKHLEAPHASA